MNRAACFIFSLFVAGTMGLSLWGFETTIKGGRMELENKGENVFFKGGVRLDRGNDVLKAYEMETNKSRDKVKASGKVEFLRIVSPTEKCKGFGDKGFYDTQTGEGYLIGGSTWSHIIYIETPSTGPVKQVDIYASRFDFLKDNSRAVGTGFVYGKTIDSETKDIYEFWSDEATYVGAEKIIVLTGKTQPKVYQQSGKDKKIIHGDKITYHMDSKKFISEGKANAYFFDDKSKENK